MTARFAILAALSAAAGFAFFLHSLTVYGQVFAFEVERPSSCRITVECDDAETPDPDPDPAPDLGGPCPPRQKPLALKHVWGADWQGRSVLEGVTPDTVKYAATLYGHHDACISLTDRAHIDASGCPDGVYQFRYKAWPVCNGERVRRNSASSNAKAVTFRVGDVADQPVEPPVVDDPPPDELPDPDPPEDDLPADPPTPAPEITWQPKIQTDYVYSEPNVCTDGHISYDAEVTLQDGETLEQALDRLAPLVEAAEGTGGRILVPWDVETQQCDRVRFRDRHGVMTSFALSGVRGPGGELPRFYCRAAKLGGDIPKGGGAGGLFWAVPGSTLLENVEINGYGTWFNSGYTGKDVVRNSYLHGATNNGIVNGGLHWDRAGSYGPRTLEACGNNISRAGQGNAKHCFYVKRGLPGEESTYRIVDNVIHSCNWSEGFKSTGEFNLVSGNRFYKTVPPAEHQPSNPDWELTPVPTAYSGGWTQTLLNIPSCSNSIIRNNLFHLYRPKPSGYANANAIILSGRRSITGCDRPRGYVNTASKAAEPDYSSPFWSSDYWEDIEGTFPFTHVIEGNTFELAGPVDQEERTNPKGAGIKMYGTYPVVAVRQFGSNCLLEAPPFWRERSRAFVSTDNTWIGFDLNPKSSKFIDVVPGHKGYNANTGEESPTGACLVKGYPFPPTADLREVGKIVETEAGDMPRMSFQ